MIKTSNHGYITITRFDYYGIKAVPTGRLEDEKAEFICISPQSPTGKVWLQRNEIT